MRLKAKAEIRLKKSERASGLLDDQLKRITEVTGIERTIVSDFVNFEAILLDHYLDDPAAKRLISLLEEEMRITVSYLNTPVEIACSKGAVSIQLTKEFEDEDLQNTDYFVLSPQKEIGFIDYGNYWDDETSCPIEKSSIAKIKHRIGRLGGSLGFQNRVLCDQFIRSEIEPENFLGLSFVEREVIGRGKEDIQIFEIISDIVLPASCNSFMGSRRDPLSEYAEEGTCNISQESFPLQLEYKKESVASFPDFDVAITHETFGDEVPDQKPSRYRFPMIIVSRNFRDWCLSKKWRLDFIPIKVIE